MRFGFVGPAYTARSSAMADEELINLYVETVMSQSSISPTSSYGGRNAQTAMSLLGTPGLSVFAVLPGTPRGQCLAGGRSFAVGGSKFCELAADGTVTVRGDVGNDMLSASIAWNSIQVLIVSAGRAFCFTLATNVLLEVTAQLAGVPVRCDYDDTYFVVMFQNSNKYQMSQVLDGSTWPGQLVNEVSVFAENIVSIICNHRELWVFGPARSQPYQDTGSTEVFDVIPGALIETGCVSPFVPCLLDNSVFWVSQDIRGGRMAWRSNGYTPQRVSTYAVEYDLSTYTQAQIGALVSYAYQDGGHLFWVLYVPGSSWSWVYDVSEGLWHKRAKWANGQYAAHWGWNHQYAFGLHLIGDWNSGNLYQMSTALVTDAGAVKRWLRRSPTVITEMSRVYHAELTIDVEAGLGPQPPLLDGAGKPRAPQIMLRWSDNRGKTWSNEHVVGLGKAGEYNARAIWRRLGQSRYRVYEASGTDPIPWTIIDAYLRTAA